MCWAGICAGTDRMNRRMQLLRVPTRSMPRKFTRSYGKTSWRMFTRYLNAANFIVISADGTPRNTSELGTSGNNTMPSLARAEEGMISHVFLCECSRCFPVIRSLAGRPSLLLVSIVPSPICTHLKTLQSYPKNTDIPFLGTSRGKKTLRHHSIAYDTCI
jgi:hypothetical protein